MASESVTVTIFGKEYTLKGGADPASLHQVDAISGGTITSKALEDMLVDCLTGYVAHFKQLSSN